MSHQPRVLRLLPVAMSCHMEFDACQDSGKQEKGQESLHTHFASYSLPKTWHLEIGIRNKENAMRTSLDALLATNASIGILKCRMLMPQESNLADYILRALLHTLPASYTMAWIHRYKLSQKLLHIYLLFFDCKITHFNRKQR